MGLSSVLVSKRFYPVRLYEINLINAYKETNMAKKEDELEENKIFDNDDISNLDKGKKGRKKKKGKKGEEDNDEFDDDEEFDDDDPLKGDKKDKPSKQDTKKQKREASKAKRKAKQKKRDEKKRMPFGLKMVTKSKGKIGTVDSLSDFLRENIEAAASKQRHGDPIIIVGKRKGDKKQKPRILELKELKKKMNKEQKDKQEQNASIIVVTGDRAGTTDANSLEEWATLVGFTLMTEEKVIAYLGAQNG